MTTAVILDKLRKDGILVTEDWTSACLQWIDEVSPTITPAARLLQVRLDIEIYF